MVLISEAVRQFGELVNVVTHAGSHAPVPVVAGDEVCADVDVESLILKLTAVAPVLGNTCQEVGATQGEQVTGPGIEIVESCGEAIVEETALDAGVEATSGFPLEFGVTDVLETQGRRSAEEKAALKVALRSVVGQTIVTAETITSLQLQVVHSSDVEPALIGNYPSCLNTREDTPYDSCEFQPFGIVAELGTGLHGDVALEVVAVGVVVLGLSVPREAGPILATAVNLLLLGAGNLRSLVVAGVIAALLGEIVAFIHIAETAEKVNAVGVVAVLPLHLGVAEDTVLAGVERTDHVLHLLVESLYPEGRNAVHGDVSLLICVHKRVAEEGRELQVLVGMPGGSDGEVDVRVIVVVLVLRRGILEDCCGVRQLVVGIAQLRDLREVVLIIDVKVRLGNNARAIVRSHKAVRREHRAFGIAEEVQRGDRTLVVLLRSAEVIEFTRAVAETGVKADVNPIGDLDIRVETDIQAIVVHFFYDLVGMEITYGKHIVSHVATTLYTQSIALGDGSVVGFLGPVCVVSVLVVVVVVVVGIGGIVGTFVQELETLHLRSRALHEGACISLELCAVHHAEMLGNELHTHVCSGGNAGGERGVALGLYENHAVGTFGTIEGCSVAHDLHALNVVNIEVRENVVVESRVNHLAVVLHLRDDTVNDHQRLCATEIAANAADLHVCAESVDAAALCSAHLRSELILNLRCDIGSRGEIESFGSGMSEDVVVFAV